MRLATVLAPGYEEPSAAEVRGEQVVLYDEDITVVDLLASGVRRPADGDVFALADVELLAPIARPQSIYAIGLNYRKHAEETGATLPEAPMVFLKASGSSVPGSGPVVCPAVVKRLDYEVELAVVMGANGEIAGYAVANDVSARDLQKREPRWVRAKGADTFCPWGPWITTADEVPNPGDLQLRCWVNGDLRQDSRTSDLVFDIPTLVSFIAETCSFAPGDLILTGTPQGVGQAMDPPQFLAAGDVIRMEIEGLGTIEHPVS